MPTLGASVSMSDVAEILHAAVILGPTAWHNPTDAESDVNFENEDTLRQDLLDLFALLHTRKISYLLVGGIAMLTYVDGRNTKNVDLVLSVDSLEQLPEIAISARDRDFARGNFNKLRVDVLFTTNPLFRLVHDRYATSHGFLETIVRCATVEGLVLLKLYALPALYLQGDGQRIGLYENDIFMLIDLHQPKLDPLLAELSPFVDEHPMTELHAILDDIQRRIDRVNRARARNKPR